MEGVAATAIVTVFTPVSAIVLSPSPALEIATGGTAALTRTALDANGIAVTAGVLPQWTSSDPTRVAVLPNAGSPLRRRDHHGRVPPALG